MDILLIGGNGFGKVHAETYRHLNLEFSVYDRNEDVLNWYRDNFNVRHAYSDLNEALSSKHDMADIVLPHNMHYDVAMRALESSMNVLIEKPLTGRIDEAIKLYNLSKRKKLKLMVAEQFYFDSSFRHSLDVIRSGRIGKVRTVIVRDQRFYDAPSWRSRREGMLGGAMIDGGIHFLEVFLDFGGDWSQITSYSYKGGTRIEVEDNTSAIFRFKDDVFGIFFYSWSYRNPPSPPAFEVVGTEGSIYESHNGTYNSGAARRVFGDPVINGKLEKAEEVDVYDSEISGFIRSVERDEPVPYPVENAIRNLDVVSRM